MSEAPELLQYGGLGFAVIILGVLVVALKYFIDSSMQSRKFMEHLVEKNDETQRDTSEVLHGMVRALDAMRSQMKIDREASRVEHNAIVERIARVEVAAEKIVDCINGMKQ